VPILHVNYSIRFEFAGTRNRLGLRYGYGTAPFRIGTLNSPSIAVVDYKEFFV
jgi:hypothetical protein